MVKVEHLKLSIVIATWNRGERLVRTLRSITRQTLPASEWEAVVVNNNSTDDTASQFTAFAAAHPEFDLRMVSEPKQGLSHARNRGIAESRGEIVAIIDDDEEINPEFAAAYIDFFARHPEALMAGGKVVPTYEAARPRWMSRFTERPIAGTLDLGEHEKPFTKGYPAGGNMAVRRTAFDTYGVFDTSLGRTGSALVGGEEKELAHRIASASKSDTPVWWVPGAVIYHIIPPSKLTLDYFRRLSRGVGASEMRRTLAVSKGAYNVAVVKEILKWVATLAIALWYLLTLHPAKARYLVIMRAGITKGLLGGK